MLRTQSDVTAPQSLNTAYDWIDLDDLHSEPLIEGANWWRTTRGERRFPTREDLRPRQISKLLAYMSLLEVIDDGADFKHRIVGDVMVQAFNVPLQHRRFSEIVPEAPEFMERCFKIFRHVVRSGKPLAWRVTQGDDSAPVIFRQSEVVLLPLGHKKVDHLLGFYSHPANAEATTPA